MYCIELNVCLFIWMDGRMNGWSFGCNNKVLFDDRNADGICHLNGKAELVLLSIEKCCLYLEISCQILAQVIQACFH